VVVSGDISTSSDSATLSTWGSQNQDY